jgi:hypothetical protein
MRRVILFVGYIEDEAKSFIKNIVKDCWNEYDYKWGMRATIDNKASL